MLVSLWKKLPGPGRLQPQPASRAFQQGCDLGTWKAESGES